MGKISSYNSDTTPVTSDYLLGNSSSGPTTMRFLVSNLITTIFGNLPTTVQGGWQAISGLSFTSWDATNATGVMASSNDYTGVISVGDRLQITQSTTQYAIVTAITSSSITAFFGTQYTLSNATINTPYFSNVKVPFGFPIRQDYWTITLSSATTRTTTSTTLASLTDTFTCPIGAFRILFKVFVELGSSAAATQAGAVTLSTDGSSETNPRLTCRSYYRATAAASNDAGATLQAEDYVVGTGTTTYTMMGVIVGTTTLTVNNSNSDLSGITPATTVRFICGYL